MVTLPAGASWLKNPRGYGCELPPVSEKRPHHAGWKITLAKDVNRQVRRMTAHVGFHAATDSLRDVGLPDNLPMANGETRQIGDAMFKTASLLPACGNEGKF